jgi:hypothetical protein
MSEVGSEIRERVAALTPAQQHQVLEYIGEVTGEPQRAMSGEEWLRGIPRISEETARELREALEECRRIDPSGW